MKRTDLQVHRGEGFVEFEVGLWWLVAGALLVLNVVAWSIIWVTS